MSKHTELQEIINKANKALKEEGKIYLANAHPEVSRIRTGILTLDVLTGGGLPRGMLTEFTGAESSYKSSSALECTAAVQRQGGIVAWCAREGFDRDWARKRGVDISKLYLIEARYGDTMLETAMELYGSGALDLLVLDSFQAFQNEREAEAGIEAESFGGGGAGQLWGRVMKRAYTAWGTGGKNTAIIGISQVREAIGKMGFKGQKPDPEPTSIRAIRHWKSISLYFKKGEPFYLNPQDADRKRLYAREFKVKCIKNKTAVPELSGSFTLRYIEHEGIPAGIDRPDQIVRLGRAYGVLNTKGAWIEYKNLRANGVDAFCADLRKQPKLLDEIESHILKAVNT